jgi:hypothetical protein
VVVLHEQDLALPHIPFEEAGPLQSGTHPAFQAPPRGWWPVLGRDGAHRSMSQAAVIHPLTGIANGDPRGARDTMGKWPLRSADRKVIRLDSCDAEHSFSREGTNAPRQSTQHMALAVHARMWETAAVLERPSTIRPFPASPLPRPSLPPDGKGRDGSVVTARAGGKGPRRLRSSRQ